ncbi:hypothetical protein ACFFX0_02410 [Citricoccus parietis]|uniref:Gfo/Idh/MocA-like oxidoreductase C-terminal domain-containing protein n=1 Tax=Citricoccus parietis TaxID=592307 RepID=A0ABV5FTU7_9MICC
MGQHVLDLIHHRDDLPFGAGGGDQEGVREAHLLRHVNGHDVRGLLVCSGLSGQFECGQGGLGNGHRHLGVDRSANGSDEWTQEGIGRNSESSGKDGGSGGGTAVRRRWRGSGRPRGSEPRSRPRSSGSARVRTIRRPGWSRVHARTVRPRDRAGLWERLSPASVRQGQPPASIRPLTSPPRSKRPAEPTARPGG